MRPGGWDFSVMVQVLQMRAAEVWFPAVREGRVSGRVCRERAPGL